MQHSQRDFFYAVLSGAGLPCVATINPTRPGAKHSVYNDLEEFCNALSGVDYSKDNYYFAISTLKDASVTAKDGKLRIRVKENAYRTRCFILDVDIRSDKPGFFTTKEAGLEGIELVRQSLSLPKPIIVDSGFGFHVYWPLAEGIESSKWAKIAAKFRQRLAAISPECVADASRVADQAGILRVPGSFNLKNGERTPVRIIQWMDDTVDLNAFMLAVGANANGDSPAPRVNIQIAIPEQQPTPLVKVAKNCNWVAQYLATRNKASEPEWYAMLGLAPYITHTTKQGEELSGLGVAHILSNKHPEYTEEGTAKKYEQAKNAQSGPTTCAKFQDVRSDWCDGCPFKSTVKTPVQVGRLDKPKTEEEKVETVVYDDLGNKSTETVTIPLPPAPYYRGEEEGGVYIRVKTKDPESGEWTEVIDKIYDYDLYPTKRFRTESVENEVMEVHVWLPKDGLRKFKIPTMLLADNKKLVQALAEKGVVAEYGKGHKVSKFLTDYIRHLQTNMAAEIEFSRFGWRDALSADPKFVVGDGFYDANNELHPATFAPFLKDMSRAVAQQGNIEAWKRGFNVYKDIPDSDQYILVSMLGFAAPLMALTDYSGVLINLVGHSGGGKSTALKVMTSVWGEPNPTHVLTTDTDISVFNTIGYLNSVPVAFDEITKMEEDRISRFILNFTTGRGKRRASRDGTNKSNDVEWDTIICCTSNTSVYDKLAAQRKGYNAEAMRVYELDVQPSDERYKTKVDAAMALLRENYGIAGREYINYVLPRAIKIRELLDRTIQSITERGGLRNEERFWGVMLACVQVGGKIAQKLGFHTYDIDALISTMLGEKSDGIRSVVKTTTSDAVSVLSDYLNNNLNAIFKVDNGRPSLAGDQNRLQAIRIRMEYKDGVPDVAYLSIGALRDYCALKKIDPSWLRKELLDRKIILRENLPKRLATGSSLTNTSVKCWEIDLQNKYILEAVQEISDETHTQNDGSGKERVVEPEEKLAAKKA